MRFGRMSAAEALAALKDLGAVRQGGPANQSAANSIQIGFGTSGFAIRGQVDGTDFGEFFSSNYNAIGGATNGSGWQKLPSGWLIQGASSVVSTDANARAYIPLVTAGTTPCLAVPTNGDANTSTVSPLVYGSDASSFTILMPGVPNGTVRINWFAFSRWK